MCDVTLKYFKFTSRIQITALTLGENGGVKIPFWTFKWTFKMKSPMPPNAKLWCKWRHEKLILNVHFLTFKMKTSMPPIIPQEFGGVRNSFWSFIWTFKMKSSRRRFHPVLLGVCSGLKNIPKSPIYKLSLNVFWIPMTLALWKL